MKGTAMQLDTLTATIMATQSLSVWVDLSSHRPVLFYFPATWKVDTEVGFHVSTVQQPGPIARLRRPDGTPLIFKPIAAGGGVGAAIIADPAWFQGVRMLQLLSLDDSGAAANQDVRADILIKAM
jgi:hypothetical protein